MKLDKGRLEEMCKHISSREVSAAKAERDSIKYKQAEYLSDKIGHVFEGIVTGITDWGIYVELIDNKCEGLIRYQGLDGKWNIDIGNFSISNIMGNKIRLGDNIQVIISKVNIERKQIDFSLF